LNTAADRNVLAALIQLASLPEYRHIYCAAYVEGALLVLVDAAFGVEDKFQQLLSQEQRAHPTAPSAQRLERLRETACGLACCHAAFIAICSAALRDAYPAAVSLLCATAPLASAVAAPAAARQPAPHADGIEAMVACLRSGSMSAEQCADCFTTLLDMIEADASCTVAASQADIWAAVLAALRQHASDAPMQEVVDAAFKAATSRSRG
jgi:hypothetical protein